MTQRQLELFKNSKPQGISKNKKLDTSQISQYLTARCKRPVDVVFTDNTSTMISIKRDSRYKLRLHHMFFSSPPEILNALAVYIKWPRHKLSNTRLSNFIRENSIQIRKHARAGCALETEGAYYDLQGIFNKINEAYFNGRLVVPITWGRVFKGVRKRSIRFGCVDEDTGIITINPALDASFIPEFFIEYIVYHEMLHCDIDECVDSRGRKIVHHWKFRAREKEFQLYEKAIKWQKNNLYRFLGRRSKG